MHSCSMTIEANLCELTATTLAKALARREISARAVLEAHLARIAAHDARFSAFIPSMPMVHAVRPTHATRQAVR